MNITEHNLTVSKTARYYTFGNDITRARYIWFACHGYGQLAKYFIRSFSFLDPDIHFVIAPEGLNRFYAGGVSGKVGATWMTSEARHDEINDHVAFLNILYADLEIGALMANAKCIGLGFSQGVATLCRWMVSGYAGFHHAVLWGGSVPSDMDVKKAKAYFENVQVWCCTGDSDLFISPESIEKTKVQLNEYGVQAHWYQYAGGHTIPKEALEQLLTTFG